MLDASLRGEVMSRDVGILDLLNWIFAQQSARGGEVRNLRGAPHSRGRWHELPADWLVWEPQLSVPWKSHTRSKRDASATAYFTSFRLAKLGRTISESVLPPDEIV